MKTEAKKALLNWQVDQLVARLGESLNQLRLQQHISVRDLCRSVHISAHTLTAV